MPDQPWNTVQDCPRVVGHDPGGKSKPRWPADSTVTAEFSECGQYRYLLREVWDIDRPLVAWLMMNPSVAGIEHSDPTLRKTGTFARLWGYGGQVVVNVHAYRATDCKRLMQASDPCGPRNEMAVLRAGAMSPLTILAYGKPPKPLRPRADRIVKLLADAGTAMAYLRLSNDGTPYHPLYLPGDTTPTMRDPADRWQAIKGLTNKGA